LFLSLDENLWLIYRDSGEPLSALRPLMLARSILKQSSDALPKEHRHFPTCGVVKLMLCVNDTRLRTEPDVLIALNTGGRKIVVGTLIAQSLINEGLQHVVYVCRTIDLDRERFLIT
jgi:hypothetical protein